MRMVFNENPAAPYGFDPQELWPVPLRLARQKLGLPLNKFIVLQLGSMLAQRGLDTAIESLALLRRQHGLDAMLLVVGDPDGQAGQCEACELARQLGVHARLAFSGHHRRPQLRYYYSAANAFVSTPWHDAHGRVPVEAMACACPVIGADAGRIRHALIDGANGFLVPLRDPQALADRLATLHANPDLACALGEAGMRHVHQYFTFPPTGESMPPLPHDNEERCSP
jgi:D-inositol-3-phosphate glycosyltransferase